MDSYNRDCLAIIEDSYGKVSVLVVSSDEDRESFRSDLLEYRDFSGDPQTVLAVDSWLSSMWKSPGGHHFACEVLGSVYWQDATGFRSEKLSPDQLFRIWGLNEQAVFTVGAAGRCFAFDGIRWSDIGAGLKGYLHAVHGASPDCLVTAGDAGFAALWNGSSWSRLDLPVGFNFRSAYMLRPSEIYFCGLNGACVHVRDEEMTVIEGTTASLYGIAEYGGKLYFGSAEAGIFLLDQGALVPFKPKARGYDISATERRLWTCGATQAASFDGTKWSARTYS